MNRQARSTARHSKAIPSLPHAPAPGYRLANSGVLYDIGYRGYSWASTASGTNGMFFSFFTQHLYPSTTGSRSHGLSLRCLSE